MLKSRRENMSTSPVVVQVKVIRRIQPREHSRKKETRQASLLGFIFFGILGSRHVASEESAAGGIAAVPV